MHCWRAQSSKRNLGRSVYLNFASMPFITVFSLHIHMDAGIWGNYSGIVAKFQSESGQYEQFGIPFVIFDLELWWLKSWDIWSTFQLLINLPWLGSSVMCSRFGKSSFLGPPDGHRSNTFTWSEVPVWGHKIPWDHLDKKCLQMLFNRGDFQKTVYTTTKDCFVNS